MTEFTAKELADLVGGRLVGPGDACVQNAHTLESAGGEDLAFLRSAEGAAKAAACRAAVIITPVEMEGFGGAQIVCEDAELAMAEVLEELAARQAAAAGRTSVRRDRRATVSADGHARRGRQRRRRRLHRRGDRHRRRGRHLPERLHRPRLPHRRAHRHLRQLLGPRPRAHRRGLRAAVQLRDRRGGLRLPAARGQADQAGAGGHRRHRQPRGDRRADDRRPRHARRHRHRGRHEDRQPLPHRPQLPHRAGLHHGRRRQDGRQRDGGPRA